MRDFLRNTFIVVGLLVGLGAPAHADKTFNIGSLVIPTSGAYQDHCGSVAVYGLVYNVLRANAYLEANKATLCPSHTAAQTCKIELYYSIKASKGSPNRCTPTDLDAGPAYTGVPSPLHSDPNWNDGCDFEINNPTLTPARLVNNTTNPPSMTTDADIVTKNTVGDTSVFPQFASRTATGTSVKILRYAGAPFIVDAIDAPLFMKLLSGNITAKDSSNNNIDFLPFRTAGTCTFGTTVGGYVNVHRAKTVFTAPVTKSFSAAPPRLALLATDGAVSATDIVDTSSKTIDTSANSGARKVTAQNFMTFKTTQNHGFSTGDWVKVSGVGVAAYNTPAASQVYTITVTGQKTFTVPSTAGLVIGNSGNGTAMRVGAYKITATGVINIKTQSAHGLLAGHPVSVSGVGTAGYNGNWTVASAPTTTTVTIADAATALAVSGGGDIIRVVAASTKKVSDDILQKYLRSAGLNFPAAGGCPPGGANVGNTTKCPSGGVRGQIYDSFDFSDIAAGLLDTAYYKMIWTPHWETTSNASTAPNAGEQATILKINQFLDQQTGLMAECQSIQAFEGSYLNGGASGPSHATAYQFPGFFEFLGQSIQTGQFQTCVGAAGVCSGSTTAFGMNKNVLNPTYDGLYQNCTDPTLSATNKCIFFGYPGDPFAQPGDFVWANKFGAVQNYKPNASTSSIYKPGVLPLISGVDSLDTTKLALLKADPLDATGRTMLSTEYATRNQKDNNPAKGQILYMAGHDVSGVVSGTKVILQTLLLLGEPPVLQTTEEVSRASPIIVAIGGVTSIVQGSFDQIDPSGSTITADMDTQVINFRFPDIKGHMRAVDIANVNAQTPIKDLVEIFDAADQLPDTTNSYTGCGGNAFGAGSGNCRTVFTHTGTGMGPARVLFQSSESTNTALKTLVNLGGGTINTEFPTFMQRIIAGQDNGGSFKAALGGVDRSTVAVIPSSATVPGAGARETIVYFGGTDGMLHAVCGSLSSPAGPPCDVLGRELWAFIPRRQLGYLRKNLARVDGSPRVMDVYADLDGPGPGTKGFKTLLVFQTTYGQAAYADQEPSMTALDISDPTDPKIAWDYALPGQGLLVNVGRVTVGGVNKYLAFAQTNTGSGASGNVVTAVDVETGTATWVSGGPVVGSSYMFTPGTAPARASGTIPPVTGIPGGAVGVDTRNTGNVTDVVFGTLYGDLWQLDAATGTNRHGTTPLFQFTTDEHPFGSPPAIFGDGSLYALAAPGGYADLAAGALWSAASQTAVAVRLSPVLPTGTVLPLTEASGPPGMKFTFAMASGDKVYSQPVISGDSAYISAESLDANALAYGSATANTGRVYRIPLAPACVDTSPADGICDNAPGQNAAGVSSSAVAGGVSSVVVFAGSVYAVGKNAAEKLGNSDATAGGTAGTSMNSTGTTVAVSTATVPRVTRKMWLRTL